MAVLPELVNGRSNHFLFVKVVAIAAKISIVTVTAAPTITPHQKSGIYMRSPLFRYIIEYSVSVLLAYSLLFGI